MTNVLKEDQIMPGLWNINKIHTEAKATILTLGDLRQGEDPFGRVQEIHNDFDLRLLKFDRVIKEFQDDDWESVRWGFQMMIARNRLKTLKRNLAPMGRMEWNWDEVLSAIAILHAINRSAECAVRVIFWSE